MIQFENMSQADTLLPGHLTWLWIGGRKCRSLWFSNFSFSFSWVSAKTPSNLACFLFFSFFSPSQALWSYIIILPEHEASVEETFRHGFVSLHDFIFFCEQQQLIGRPLSFYLHIYPLNHYFPYNWHCSMGWWCILFAYMCLLAVPCFHGMPEWL